MMCKPHLADTGAKAGLKIGGMGCIPGQSKPQGVFYSPDFKKLVANGGDDSCKIFAGDTFQLVDNLPIGADADHVGYDPATKYLYVGFSDAKSGGLAVIDTRTNKHVLDIETMPGRVVARSKNRVSEFSLR